MFKQSTNTSSTLHMFTTSNQASRQSSTTKHSQIQNFSKLLKKLQTQNVNIDQLRMLKNQHAYLQKLRQQRQKVQQLKLKYTDCQQTLIKYQEQNKNQSILLHEYATTIELLKQQLQSQKEKRIHLQSSISHKYQNQRQKMRFKISELNKEVQDLRKLVKNKDLVIMQIEQENVQKIKQIKEQFNQGKKKLIIEIQQRLKAQLDEKSQYQSQVTELRNLVTRQNKALKQQNQKYQQLSLSHQKLVSQLQRCHQNITNLTIACQEYEQKVQQLEQTNESLMESLKLLNDNTENQSQLEQLRKQMAEMAKGEIQKIEFIVNQFQ